MNMKNKELINEYTTLSAYTCQPKKKGKFYYRLTFLFLVSITRMLGFIKMEHLKISIDQKLR